LALSGCVASGGASAEAQQVALYGESTPFVLGQRPLEYGPDDPLNRYSAFSTTYGGHAISTQVEVREGMLGIEEGARGPVTVILLDTTGSPSRDLLAQIMAEACASPNVCQGDPVVSRARHSLAELRSLMSWVQRSPIGGSVVASTPIVADGAGGYRSFVEFEVEAEQQSLLASMLSLGGVPSSLYRVKVARPYTN